MSATIGTLMDRLHYLAVALDREPLPGREAEDASADALGWSRLASRLSTTLAALPFEVEGPGRHLRDGVLTVLGVLRVPAVRGGQPAPQLEEAAVLVGAIGDLLVANRAPFTVVTAPQWRHSRRLQHDPVFTPRDPDDAAASGLQSNLLAAAYAMARWSLHRVPVRGVEGARLVRSLHQLCAVAEPHALLDPERRGSGLELIAAVPHAEASLLGAVQRWTREAESALHRRLVTSGTFAMMASDLSVLTAAVVHASSPALALVEDPKVRQGLGKAFVEANADWKRLAAWPTDIRLGGPRAQDFIERSRQMRSLLATEFRSEGGWRTPADLAERHPGRQLDTLAHGLATQAAWVGDALAKTIRDMTMGQGRLWVDLDAARSVHPDYTSMRWIPQPDGAHPVAVDVPWQILSKPTQGEIDLARTATQAAAHTQRGAALLESVLGAPTLDAFEVIPALSLTRNRLHVVHAPGPSVSRGVPR